MLAAAREERGKDVLIEPWRLHDLRRSDATGMADIGIQPHIIEAVLNHVSGARAGVAGTYNRAAYAPEKKAARDGGPHTCRPSCRNHRHRRTSSPYRARERDMARRKYPPRVSRNWRFLQEMQQLVEGGMTPNAAAIRIARQHWRVITNGTYEAAIHWLKDNQRRFSAQLQGLNCDIATFDPTEFFQSLNKGSDPLALAGRRALPEKTDNRQFARLLSPRGERPREDRAAE
jgi:hypothetical protein